MNRFMILLLITVLLMGLMSGCSTRLNDILDAGAEQFAGNRPEDDYALTGGSAVLNEMLDKYAGSRYEPSVEAPDVDVETDTSSLRVYPVDSDDDLREVLHVGFENVSTAVKVLCEDSYEPDFNSLRAPLRDEIESVDHLSTIGVVDWLKAYSADESQLLSIVYMDRLPKVKEMRTQTMTLVETIADEIRETATTDYERVCAVNQYLCNNVVYAEPTVDRQGNKSYPARAHTAYGALAEGEAVCDGYSGAAMLLLKELGIDCRIQFGETVNKESHAWNLVCLDGKWYQMDVTWNDTSGFEKRYLLVTDTQMRLSRTWDYSEYPSTPIFRYWG